MNIAQGLSWTASRVARLEDLWELGWSASEIAADLGGVSRNAVLGKADRLGLSARREPPPDVKPANAVRRESRPPAAPREIGGAAPRAAKARESTPPPKAVKPPKAVDPVFARDQRRLRVVQTEGRFVPLKDLNPGECHYPIDDPGPGQMDRATFCGAATGGEGPYCPAHRTLCSGGRPKGEIKKQRRPGEGIHDGFRRQRLSA